MSIPLRKQIAGLPPAGGGSLSTAVGRGGGHRPRMQPDDFTPIPYSEFFDEKKMVKISSSFGDGKFCVYSRYAPEVAATFGESDPVILFIHGGGFSSLSWSRTVYFVGQVLKNVQMVAVDLRGHGETKSTNDENLSLEVLTDDVIKIIEETGLCNRPLVLVGHSLGGSVATNVAKELQESFVAKVVALIVLDIVEGTAIEALSTMHKVIRGRPENFVSVDAAIGWSLKSGQVRDRESARVSVPGQLKYISTGLCASETVGLPKTDSKAEPPIVKDSETTAKVTAFSTNIDSITEETEDEGVIMKPPASVQPVKETAKDLAWRINLLETEPYWKGWFEGLSQKFLQVQCPKFLLLAGIERLDKELMVGQMQGQFQMVVLSKVGHSLHEDNPEQVADAISTFLIRHRLAMSRAGIAPVVFPGC